MELHFQLLLLPRFLHALVRSTFPRTLRAHDQAEEQNALRAEEI